MEHFKFVNMVTEAICKLEAQGHLNKIFNVCWYQYDKDDGTVACCIVGHMMKYDHIRVAAEDFGSAEDSSITSLYQEGFHWTQQFHEGQIVILQELQALHDNLNNDLTFPEIISKMRTRIAEYSYHLR